jgi:PAS domain S-box-containing protein
MTNAAIIDLVRQQLAHGVAPTTAETAALLMVIDRLTVELRQAQEDLALARLDQSGYQALIAAHEALITARQHDSLEHQRTAAALHESEARYRAIAELTSDYAYTCQVAPDGQVICEWATDAFTRITGYSFAELEGQGGWFSLIHPDDLPIVESRIQRLLAGQLDQSEFRIITKSGATRWLRDSGRPVWDQAAGRVVRILGATSDITERKLAEDRLSFLAHVGTLFASSLDCQTTLEQVGRLMIPFLADACLIELIGEDQLIHGIVVAHHDPDKEQLLRAIRECYPIELHWPRQVATVLQTGKPELITTISEAMLREEARDEVEFRAIRQLNLTSAMIVPLRARDRVLGTLIFLSEKTGHEYNRNDLALAEELGSRAGMAVDNARLYSEAQAAVEARDQFLSIAAHELKTPTTALISAAYRLRAWSMQSQSSSEQARRELQVIDVTSQRLNKLINSLTEFAQIETGRFRLERSPVVLCALVRQVLSELQPTPQHDVNLRCADETLTIEADPIRLEQAIYNLVQNAIKYSPHGGIVMIRVAAYNNQALISVTDQGIGIPASAQAQLFQRFYRADNAVKQHFGGMGIGLYLIKEIVTRHGGEVEVNSAEGQGSTFTIRLPLKQETFPSPLTTI